MSRSVAVVVAVVVLLGACRDEDGPLPPRQQRMATRLSFASTPWPVGAGAALAPVEVFVLDAGGVVVNAAVEVTLTASAGPLDGTTSAVAVNGVARFTDLSLTRAGTTTLIASAQGLEGDETAPFAVWPGPTASLEFDAQPPATATAGEPLPDVKVSARDAYGNLATGDGRSVTLSLSGAQLFGETTRPLVSGVATFAGLSVRRAGTGYRLTAWALGVVARVESAALDVWSGPADRLVFAVQPTSTVAGDVITPAVQVRVEDAFGNLVPEAREVTLSATALDRAFTAIAVGGVATFADLSPTLAGEWTATATASDVTTATSAAFYVAPGAPASLAFSAQPQASVVAGGTMSTVRVAVSDAYGNACTNAYGWVELTLEGAELLGSRLNGVASGVASFSGLSVRKAGTGYELSASGFGFGPVKSSAFQVIPGAVHHLAFTRQPPPTAVAGTTLAPAIAVAACDAYDNVTPAWGSVALGLSSPVPGAALLGTATRSAVAGTATFDDLSVRTAAADYRLNAAMVGLPVTTSEPFTILAGDATKLAFRVQPTGIRSGQEMVPPVEVFVADDWLNVAATTEREVTLALEPNAEGAALDGATAAATSGRIATFPGLTVLEPASGCRIRATAPGLADAVSGPFQVSPNWISTGPDGGDIAALATDPAVSDVAYAATNGCVWRTSNGAYTWARACRGLPFPLQIERLVVHPSSSARLFAASSGGLYSSDDAGASWSVVGSLGAAVPYRTLSVAVAASGAIYAGTFEDGLQRSDDGGASWTRLAAGLAASRITAIAIEPASTEVLYAAGVDPNGVGTVYRSLDRGDTWAETALGPATFPGVKPTALVVDPSSADVIFVGAGDGVYESYDRGASFTQALSGAEVRDVAAHGPSRTRFAAGTTGVWRKAGFDPWTATTSLPSSPKAIAVAVRANGTALAGTRYGVYDRSTSSTSWVLRTTGLRAFNTTAVGAGRGSTSTVVYAATSGGGVHRSLNGGATWTRGNHPVEGQHFYAIAVERGNADRAWLAGASGLYRTTNAGVTWTEVLVSQGTMYSTVLGPSSDAIVYAGGSSDVYRSSNGGGSFRDLNVCGGPVRALALSASAPLALWAGDDAGLCKVDLSGVNDIFVPYASQPGTSGAVDAIAIDPDPALAGSTVWASTSDGFHATVDGGATWTKTSGRFNALLAQPGRLFGARLLGALEVSRDGGATFAPAGTGLHHGNVRTIADVPGLPNEIYVGTSWGSVFKTTSAGE